MANDVANANAVTGSYLDFAGIARLRGEAQRKTETGNREAAQQFEAMFVQMMLKSMRDASFKSDFLNSQTMDTYQSMHDHELSMQLAKRGTMGIASMIEKQFAQTQAQVTASDELKRRQAAGEPAVALPLAKPPAGSLPLRRAADAYEISRPQPSTGFELQREFSINRAR
ncbi:MAG: rod-binding protein [Betaproteobacteria bacterium]|jgi:flagellar protein FlgJ